MNPINPMNPMNPMNLTLGYSPCPNDTFIFHALVNGRIALPGIRLKECLHDVETLNQMALAAELDVTKLSFFAWLKVQDRYRLLNSGAALGYGCGPILVARSPISLADIATLRIALPGRWTTAHLLFRLWAPRAADRIFVPYDRIFDTLAAGKADCGVIIHESRFTYAQAGCVCLLDLGAWWEQQTGLPIPLGCIAAKRSLSDEIAVQMETAIGRSIAFARQHPGLALPYMREHAQEMETAVLQCHIDTFVNDFSLDLGETGRAAVATLEEMARTGGVLE
jgi:1,4-dihydroxy-6-naphthoate synthase